jgi:hypothetical protein
VLGKPRERFRLDFYPDDGSNVFQLCLADLDRLVIERGVAECPGDLDALEKLGRSTAREMRVTTARN